HSRRACRRSRDSLVDRAARAGDRGQSVVGSYRARRRSDLYVLSVAARNATDPTLRTDGASSVTNIQTVGALLRALEASTGSSLAPQPVTSVNPVPEVRAVNTEGSVEQSPYRFNSEQGAEVARDGARANATSAALGAIIESVDESISAETLRRGSARAPIA